MANWDYFLVITWNLESEVRADESHKRFSGKAKRDWLFDHACFLALRRHTEKLNQYSNILGYCSTNITVFQYWKRISFWTLYLWLTSLWRVSTVFLKKETRQPTVAWFLDLPKVFNKIIVPLVFVYIFFLLVQYILQET